MPRWLAAVLMVGLLAGGPAHQTVPGNPVFRAIVILERRPPGAPPRVRFEWSQRAGAVEYRLLGSWTGPGSWTVRRAEYRITRRNATSWDEHQVTFEVALAPGSHSWRLIPWRSVDQLEPAGEVAHLGFDLK
ncbi:MAG: hypothetical protein AB7R55_01590 [Gemmatimonadales bacterium]